MTDKEKSIIQENLTKLYLRLNGYFTSGFIVHSNERMINSELDIIGIRFPFHNQDDTEHNSSDFLEIPENLDIIIAEVKSKGKSLKFNRSLYNEEAIGSWMKILNWIGFLNNEEQNLKLSQELINSIIPKENSQLKKFRSINLEKSDFGKISIRPIMVSPERINSNNADKFINWTEINDFLWLCLCPREEREMCGTRYDFTAWGELADLVNVYKARQNDQSKFEKIEELYRDLEILKGQQLTKN